MNKKLKVLAIAAIFSLSAAAQAAVQYEYSGNNFDTILANPSLWDTSDNVTATFMLDTLPVNVTNQIVPVADYTVSDGLMTVTPGNPAGGVLLRITTDGSGNITAWSWGWGQEMPAVLGAQTNAIGSSNNGNGVGSDSATLSECTSVFNSACTGINLIDGAAARDNPGSWTKTQSQVQAVPTISQYALVLLALLLAGVGVIRMRRT